MALILTVLEIIAPVFLVGAVGFAWAKSGFRYEIQFVTRISMTVALPCLIFVALMTTEVELGELGGLALASALAYALVVVAMVVVTRLGGLDSRTYLAPLIFGNTGNLGLPLALFAFGKVGLDYAVIVFAVMQVFAFTIGIAMVSGRLSLKVILGEPIAWGTLLGGVFLIFDLETPLFLTRTLELLGQLAIPLMLLTLGVSVARLNVGQLIQPAILSLIKFALCVICAYGAGLAFGLDAGPLGVLVVQLATPVAVTSFLIAEKYDADSTAVAGLAVVSTLISVAALPILLGFVI